MRTGPFPGVHHLKPGVDPTYRRRHVGATGIVEIDHAPPGLLGRHQIDGTQDVVAQIFEPPQHRLRSARGLPRFDLVGHRPERTCIELLELLVVGEQFGRILHVRPPRHILAI